MGIIYCYTNNDNDKKYIGQTINPKQRISAHKSGAHNPNDTQYNGPFHRAIRKYGFTNFSYEVLDELENSKNNELDDLEAYYIEKYNVISPNGYNLRPGGKTARGWSMPIEAKIYKSLQYGLLSEEEVIDLRLRYKNGESPSKIYKELYADKLHYYSFLNIWDGHRYGFIMPEVFENRGHTKLNPDIVKSIREDREKNNLSYQKLANKYNIPKPTIADIIKRRTWKNV